MKCVVKRHCASKQELFINRVVKPQDNLESVAKTFQEYVLANEKAQVGIIGNMCEVILP